MPGAATSSILGLILAITLQSPAQPPASPAPPATPAPPAPASTTPPYDGPESPVITHHELRAGGKTLRGVMFLAPMQRLSDYLSHAGKFAGISRATLLPDGHDVGDVAVNTSAIAMIREARPAAE